jgi:hypothetical protein
MSGFLLFVGIALCVAAIMVLMWLNACLANYLSDRAERRWREGWINRWNAYKACHPQAKLERYKRARKDTDPYSLPTPDRFIEPKMFTVEKVTGILMLCVGLLLLRLLWHDAIAAWSSTHPAFLFWVWIGSLGGPFVWWCLILSEVVLPKWAKSEYRLRPRPLPEARP